MDVPKLIVTPAQHAFESPLGYIVRLTESNLYPSPTTIARLARMRRAVTFSVQLDMAPIGTLLGSHASTLHGYLSEQGRTPSLCGHKLELFDIEVASSRICAQCIQELGYRPAWMDLAVIDACPYHRVPFALACGACGRKLSWARPGLLTCKCGADLSNTSIGPVGEVEEAHAKLLDGLIQCFHGNSEAIAAATLGDVSLAFSLSDWLGIVRSLAGTHSSVIGPSGPSISTVRRAATMLVDFREQMSAVFIRAAPQSPAHGGIDAQISGGVASIRRWSLVMRAPVWGALHRTFQILPIEQANPLRPLELASWSKAWESQVMKVGTKTVKTNISVRREASAGVRDVAQLAGLPIVVLTRLRTLGLLSSKRGWRSDVIHPEESLKLWERLSVLASSSTEAESELISLGHVLRHWKLGSKDAKGNLVAAILEGKTTVFYEPNSKPDELLIRASDVAAARTQAYAERFDGAISKRTVAKMLASNDQSVAGLIEMGMLEAIPTLYGQHITANSFNRFNEKYVAINVFAKKMNSSSFGCRRIAEALDFSLLHVKRKTTKAEEQSFLETKDVPAFSEALVKVLAERRLVVANHRYENPENPQQTWRGVGRHPKWLKTELAAGRTLSDFATSRKM